MLFLSFLREGASPSLPAGSAVNGFVRPHLDSGDSRWQRVQNDAIAGISGPAVVAHNLPGSEGLLACPQHAPAGVVEGYIEVRAGGIGGLQSLDDIASQGQLSALSLKPYLFDPDYGRIHALETNMGQIGRRPERRDAAGNQERDQRRRSLCQKVHDSWMISHSNGPGSSPLVGRVSPGHLSDGLFKQALGAFTPSEAVAMPLEYLDAHGATQGKPTTVVVEMGEPVGAVGGFATDDAGLVFSVFWIHGEGRDSGQVSGSALAMVRHSCPFLLT